MPGDDILGAAGRGAAVLDAFRTTEDSLALSFCAGYPDLRFVNAWGRWLAWDGARWRDDDTLGTYDQIRRHVRAVVGQNKQFAKAKTIAAIEQLARSDRRYAATHDQWDADDWTLNTRSGIVDLRTGEIRAHDPMAYARKITAGGAGGDCPTWLKFLHDITGGDPDYVGFIQRALGYALTGSTREHALFFLYGIGRNGKGTMINTIRHILGDYAAVSSADTFTESKSDRHPCDLALLQGARFVIANETEEGRSWNEAKIKTLTGGDPVSARFMRRDFFTYVPKFKLFIASNHKPRLKNVDEAIRGRLHLLLFDRVFSGAEKDPDMGQKLLAEAGGILQWMICGTKQYLEHGLRPPKIVTDATASYFVAEDIFRAWLDECCERGPEYTESSGSLFAAWKCYTVAANEPPGTQKTLGERLESEGFRPGKSGSVRHWKGLRLKQLPDFGASHYAE